MPRHKINYSKTIIYKIVCNDLNIVGCYVGHTTDLTRRKAEHKKMCRYERGKKYNYKVYTTIRNNGGWDNYKMVQVEVFPCNNRNEAVKKEREWFEILNSSLNTNYPQRTPQEWRADNKEQIAVDKREYRINNIEYIAARDKKYYDDNKERIFLRMENNKEAIRLTKKKYYDNNIELIRLYSAKYRDENNHSSVCGCGKEVKALKRTRHFKTLVHTRYLESIANIEPSV